MALKESHGDEKKYHDEMIEKLHRQCQRLQDRISQMYEDKFDGKISEEFFEQKNREWREQQADLRRKIERHGSADCAYLDEGVRILELHLEGRKATRRISTTLWHDCLYERQAEKGKGRPCEQKRPCCYLAPR